MPETVQLAHKYVGKDFDHGYYSRKFDGKRMTIMQGCAYSRTNKICRIAPIEHITKEISAHLMPEDSATFYDIVTDGEVIYFDDDYREDFKKTVSLTSRMGRSPECDSLYYVIFDILSSTQYTMKSAPTYPFKTEYQFMCEVFKAQPIEGRPDLLKTCLPHVLIARQTEDSDELLQYKDFLKWEGLMYRNMWAPYEFKRSKNILKMKSFSETELYITGFCEGEGKYKGTLGAVIADYEGNSVSIGSGFTDQERDVIWYKRWDILKDRLKIRTKYFEESEDAKGNRSLRFPTFLSFRDESSNDIVFN